MLPLKKTGVPVASIRVSSLRIWSGSGWKYRGPQLAAPTTIQDSGWCSSRIGVRSQDTGSADIHTMLPVRFLTSARTESDRRSIAFCWGRVRWAPMNQSGGELTPTQRLGGMSPVYFSSCGAAFVSDW